MSRKARPGMDARSGRPVVNSMEMIETRIGGARRRGLAAAVGREVLPKEAPRCVAPDMDN